MLEVKLGKGAAMYCLQDGSLLIIKADDTFREILQITEAQAQPFGYKRINTAKGTDFWDCLWTASRSFLNLANVKQVVAYSISIRQAPRWGRAMAVTFYAEGEQGVISQDG
jgi:hypothetical protein